MQGKCFFELRNIVVLQNQSVLHHFWRNTRAGRVAECGEARACFDQQRIGMAVVAAFKFDDLAAPCRATG